MCVTCPSSDYTTFYLSYDFDKTCVFYLRSTFRIRREPREPEKHLNYYFSGVFYLGFEISLPLCQPTDNKLRISVDSLV